MAATGSFIFFLLSAIAFSPSLARHRLENFDIRGLIAPAFTPIDRSGNINVEPISGYAQYLCDNDIESVVIGGLTGEGSKLSVAEMKTLINAWLQAIRHRNLKLVVVIGGRPFPGVLELARYCDRSGVDGIAVLPDLFSRPGNAEELVYALEIVARNAPNTPLIYYDIPRITNVNINILSLLSLATKRVSTFKAIGTDNADNGLQVIRRQLDDQRLIATNASYLAPAVYLGTDSFSLTENSIFPSLVRSIINNGSQGRLNVTNALFDQLLNLSSTIRAAGKEIPALKAAMSIVTGINVGPPRAPEQALSNESQNELAQNLRELGIEVNCCDDDDDDCCCCSRSN